MRKYRWLIWGAFVLVWTLLLVDPDPEPMLGPAESLAFGRRHLATKTAHVSCYALFAALSGWVRAPQQFRPLLMFFIMAHATSTELIQLTLAHRDGNLIDVGFDNAGILIGFLLTWKWWTEKGPEN